jgi:hypothetical protein
MPSNFDVKKVRSSKWAKEVVSSYISLNVFGHSEKIAERMEKDSFMETAKNNCPNERLANVTRLSDKDKYDKVKYEFGSGYNDLDNDTNYRFIQWMDNKYASDVSDVERKYIFKKNIKRDRKATTAISILKAFNIPVSDDIFWQGEEVTDKYAVRFCYKFINLIYKLTYDNKVTLKNIYYSSDNNGKYPELTEEGYKLIPLLLKKISQELTADFLSSVEDCLDNIMLTREMNYLLLFSIGKPSQPMGGALTKDKIIEYLIHINNKMIDIEKNWYKRKKKYDKAVNNKGKNEKIYKLNIAENSYLSLVGLVMNHDNDVMVKELYGIIKNFLPVFEKSYKDSLIKISKQTKPNEYLDLEKEDQLKQDTLNKWKEKHKHYLDFLPEGLKKMDRRTFANLLKRTYALCELTSDKGTKKIPISTFLYNLVICDATKKIYKISDTKSLFVKKGKNQKHDAVTIFGNGNLATLCKQFRQENIQAMNYQQWLIDNYHYVKEYGKSDIVIINKCFMCIADLVGSFSEAEYNECMTKILKIIKSMTVLNQKIYESNEMLLASHIPCYYAQWEFRYAGLAAAMFCYNLAQKSSVKFQKQDILEWYEKISKKPMKDLEAATVIDFYYQKGDWLDMDNYGH